jgi:hypothetical protein
MQVNACPVCRGFQFSQVVNTAAIRREIRLRREFVQDRLRRKAQRSELKDLMDFMHGFPAPVERCERCGLLARGEQKVPEAHAYSDDPNDRDLMAHLYPSYLEAFRRKEATYRPLLPPHADVLEIGSHLGAFLQTAEEWNWNASALDVGEDTAEFARSRGFSVHRNVIEEAAARKGSLHAVLIWNCFEQLAEPGATLHAARSLLQRHGLLVLRVPNALFYLLASGAARGEADNSFAVRALAYNNLLGFPYLFGYTAGALNRLLAVHGFEPVLGVNSELVTMPFPDRTRRIVSEQETVSRDVADWSSATTLASGVLTAPWIEMVFRKRDGSLPRAGAWPSHRIDLRFQQRAA